MSKPIAELSLEDVIPVCMSIEGATGLQCYFSDWWKPELGFKNRFNFLLGELKTKIEEIEVGQDDPDVLADGNIKDRLVQGLNFFKGLLS